MVHQEIEFHHRVERLNRKRQALRRGADACLRADGLLIAAPRRRRSGLPLKGLVLCLLVFLLFKAGLIAAVGPVTYDSRVDRLARGTLAEAAGAWVMRREPLSDRVAQEIRSWTF